MESIPKQPIYSFYREEIVFGSIAYRSARYLIRENCGIAFEVLPDVGMNHLGFQVSMADVEDKGLPECGSISWRKVRDRRYEKRFTDPDGNLFGSGMPEIERTSLPSSMSA